MSVCFSWGIRVLRRPLIATAAAGSTGRPASDAASAAAVPWRLSTPRRPYVAAPLFSPTRVLPAAVARDAVSATPPPSALRRCSEDMEEDEAALLESVVAAIPFAPQVIRVSSLYTAFASPSPSPSPPSTAPSRSCGRSGKAGPAVDRRRWVRERYRTMRNLLVHLCQESHERYWGIFLSYDGMLVTRAVGEEEAGEAFRGMYTVNPANGGKGRHPHLPVIPETAFQPSDYCYPIEQPTANGERRSEGQAAEVEAEAEFDAKKRRRAAVNAALTLRSGWQVESLLEVYLTYFGESFTAPPPPDEALPTLSAATVGGGGDALQPQPRGGSAEGRPSPSPSPSSGTFTPQMLVPLLPTYFIPLSVFLRQLPEGYSAAHVSYIAGSMDCVDLVTLPADTHDSGAGGESEERRRFIRLHGGRSRVAFGVSACEVGEEEEEEAALATLSVHEQFAAAYAPDPMLCDAFAPALAKTEAGIDERRTSGGGEDAFSWRPLRSIVHPRVTPPHLLQALRPFFEEEDTILSLLFFAQMQHRFHFAADKGGHLRATRSVETAELREETTPTPIAVEELKGILRKKWRVYVCDLEQASNAGEVGGGGGEARRRREGGPLSPPPAAADPSLCLSDFTKTAVIAFYGTLRHFFACHASIFVVEDARCGGETEDAAAHRQPSRSGFAPAAAASFADMLDSPTLTVRLADSYVRRDGRRTCSQSPSLSLEDRLERALMRKDRRAARKARRRLAIAQSPDSPYADPHVLLDAVLRYLPMRRPVSLRFFLKSLPPRLADFLPEDYFSLIKSAVPHKVQLIEWRRRNQLYLLRPGLPLPDGVLRSRYTEKELLFMVAEELARAAHRHPGGDTLSAVFGRLPYGARVCLGGNNKLFFSFVEKYPQFFVTVFQDGVRMDVRSARVTLLAQPPIAPDELHEDLRSATWWQETGENPTEAELDAWRSVDEEVMRERIAQVGDEAGRADNGEGPLSFPPFSPSDE